VTVREFHPASPFENKYKNTCLPKTDIFRYILSILTLLYRKIKGIDNKLSRVYNFFICLEKE